MKLGHYILDEKGEVKEVDLYTWAEWLEDPSTNRRLAHTRVGDYNVSTVFMGLDHNFGGGSKKPILWETMIFENELTVEFMEPLGKEIRYHKTLERDDFGFARYSSKEDALQGHEHNVQELEKWLNTERNHE